MKLNMSNYGMVVFFVLSGLVCFPAYADDFVIDEETWVVLLDEPGTHLEKAHESFLKKMLTPRRVK